MPFLTPPLIWTLSAVGAAFVAKLLIREWHRVNEELEQRLRPARAADPELQAVPRLRRDPVTGIYRP